MQTQTQSHEECIKLLKEWMDYCLVQSELHNSARTHYKKVHKLVFIPATILSGVSGVSSITNIMTEKYIIMGIAFGCMSIVSVALFTLHNNFRVAEKQSMHDLYGDSFYNLHNEIKVHLTLESSDDRGYRTLAEYVKECKQRLEIMIDKAPPIPDGVAGAHTRKVLRTDRQIIVDCC